MPSGIQHPSDVLRMDRAVTTDDRLTVIATIKNEHRSLGRVLELVRELLQGIEAQHVSPDFELLSKAFYYIDDFPVRCHHPKEDEYLFKAVRRYVPQQHVIVNQLQAEHVLDRQLLRDLHSALVCYQGGALDGLKRLRAHLDVYCAVLREHMKKEEKLLANVGFDVPAAAWAAMAEAFTCEADPLFGKTQRGEFDMLRERIRMRLPAKMRRSGERSAGP